MMRHTLRHVLFGPPLPSAASRHERLSSIKALAVFSSDALSSVAYATEEILLVLVVAGGAALQVSLPVAFVIVVLLAIVATSYSQTIHGYPSGGGAYIVAHENMGIWPGLVAAGALLIDYVLTVAVSITAGVVAIVSAFPGLVPFRIELCLLLLILVTWGNLRGVRESGTIFSVPTYAFVVVFLLLILTGFVRLLTGGLAPDPTATPVTVSHSTQAITLYVVLRAFASGCTALTGVEAISNGVPAFHEPAARNASRTLVAMAILLGVMFLGITYLARALGVVPAEHESVVSQIAKQVFGPGVLYYSLQVATALILILAANTSFADFPRLSAILARDGYMPRQLANLGDRLVFSNGILLLATVTGLLIVLFRGLTHHLIPLYAVGVFLSFTLSQAGMVRHWWKLRGPRWSGKAVINGIGAGATGIVLVVILEAKFLHGAWIVVLLIPLLVWAFGAVKRHYIAFSEQTALGPTEPKLPWEPDPECRYKVVVPLSGLNRGTMAALRFARSLSKDVTAVMADLEPQETARIQQEWRQHKLDVPLVVLESPYRSVLHPLLAFLEQKDQQEPEKGLAVVVLPEFVPARWWQHLLHNQTALLLKSALIYGRSKTGSDRVIVDVPYHLRR